MTMAKLKINIKVTTVVMVVYTAGMLCLSLARLAESAESCSQDILGEIAHCSSRHLTSVPSYLLESIQTLELSHNQLSVLHNNSFTRYTMLRKLLLSDNNISRIEVDTFSSLSHLEYLTLADNWLLPKLEENMFRNIRLNFFQAHYSNIRYFPDGAIRSFESGAQLDLAGNLIEEISWPTFRVFKILDLGFNKLRKISSDRFVLKSVVSALDIGGNPIDVIDSMTISMLRVSELTIGGTNTEDDQIKNLLWGVHYSAHIKTLIFMNTGERRIAFDIFNHLDGKHLDLLELGIRSLSLHANSVLHGLRGVLKLEIRSVGLQAIEAYHFNGMTGLRNLSLTGHNIVAINSNCTSWKVGIVDLDLSGNRLREINHCTLHGLTNLKKLDLSRNAELQSIDKGSFASCTSLEILYLSRMTILNLSSEIHFPSLIHLKMESGYCPKELIHPGHLGGEAPLLVRLELIDTSIGSDNIWDPVKHISSFSGLNRLSWLDISQNPISPLPNGLFHNLSHLIFLNLKRCSIQALDVEVFRDLEKLVAFNLKSNNIKYIPSGIFDKMTKLERLFLDENELSLLDPHLFKYNRRLWYLDVSDNHLSDLSFSTFQSVSSSLKQLDLANNRFVCTCNLKWFQSWIQDSNIFLIRSSETVCLDSSSTLEQFRGKQLITFDPGEECEPNILLYSCVAVASVALALLLVVVYYQRWWIRHRLFLLKLCFHGYDEVVNNPDGENFQYDIAVMLHEIDNDWVDRHLRPALAERLPNFQRIVWGDGDLMPGMYYLDAINYAVENSLKTIFVISRAAVQDQWFMMKFRTVLNNVNVADSEKMTLVFLEDMVDAKLPFLIRLFLSDRRPYVIWTEAERGQEYFWEELIKGLTVTIR